MTEVIAVSQQACSEILCVTPRAVGALPSPRLCPTLFLQQAQSNLAQWGTGPPGSLNGDSGQDLHSQSRTLLGDSSTWNGESLIPRWHKAELHFPLRQELRTDTPISSHPPTSNLGSPLQRPTAKEAHGRVGLVHNGAQEVGAVEWDDKEGSFGINAPALNLSCHDANYLCTL